MTPTADPTMNAPGRYPVAAAHTLDRACRTAIALMQGGVDGSKVAIRVEGLRIVEPPVQRPTTGDLASAATGSAALGALLGAVVALFGGGAVLPWAVVGALVALMTGVLVGAVRYVAADRRTNRAAPLLGARRFVVHCDAADAERARRLVS